MEESWTRESGAKATRSPPDALIVTCATCALTIKPRVWARSSGQPVIHLRYIGILTPVSSRHSTGEFRPAAQRAQEARGVRSPW